jgi:hypothetical protein
MSWQNNRRRKRTWYRHYRKLCDQLVGLTGASRDGTPVAAEAIIKMFFDLYEERRMHKRRRVANSAWESFELAAKDSGLTRMVLTPGVYAAGVKRPPAIGEFGAQTRTSTAPVDDITMTGITWVEDGVPKPGGGDYVNDIPGADKERILVQKDNRDKSRPF